MKKIIPILILLYAMLPLLSSAQGKPDYVGKWYENRVKGKKPDKIEAFARDKSDFQKDKKYKLKANVNQLNSIMNSKPDVVNLTIPYGDKTYTLNLAKVEVVSDAFNVKTDKGNSAHNTGVQYRGIVNNDPEHIASMSLTPSDKTAFFSTDEGNFVVTKEGVDFVAFNDSIMELPVTIQCQTPDVSYPIMIESNLISGVGCKTVNVYFECDYAFYQNKGSNITTLTDYVVGFFNQVATIYANEDIAIQISEIFAWTVADPYVSLTTPSAVMNAFKANRGTNFNGHLAHFLTTRNIGGGVAYVDALCNKAYAFGCSRIYSTYSNFPAYSWTVNVVAHELGHNFGSPHTHSCSWNGGPIDNCQPPEGTCSPGPPAPAGGGTIMSYCQLTSAGINFNAGFGQKPGDLIRSKLVNASCIPAGTLATPPSSLTTTAITNSTATLNWVAAPSATTYTVQYKLASASGWTPAGTTSSTSMNLTGLSSNANYVWSVKADCSTFSTNTSFTTTGTGSGSCATPSQLSAGSLTANSATLTWAAVPGATGYTVQYKVSSAGSWTNTVNATTNSIVITGLTAATTYGWQVKASCSDYSSQANFVTPATIPVTCAAPSQLTSTNITQTGATLSWGMVPGATGYTVQYKVSTAGTWTNTVSATTNSVAISGLVAGTSYGWQVKANCSSYSSQGTFSTAAAAGCPAPTQLTSNSVTQTGATLNWGAVPGATGYTLQYKSSAASTWNTVTTTTNSRVLSGLSAGTNYVWRVKTNCSVNSVQASFTTTTSTGTGCAIPTNQATTNITTNSALLTWSGPSNAQSYSIRYRLVGFTGWTITNGITGTSFQVTGLQSKKNYEWKVSATCSNGTSSGLTVVKQFTTL